MNIGSDGSRSDAFLDFADLDSYSEVSLRELLPVEDEPSRHGVSDAPPMPPPSTLSAPRKTLVLPRLVPRRSTPMARADLADDVRRIELALACIADTRAWQRARDFNGRPFDTLLDYVASLGVDLEVIALFRRRLESASRPS